MGFEIWEKNANKSLSLPEVKELLQWWKTTGVICHGEDRAKQFIKALENVLKKKEKSNE